MYRPPFQQLPNTTATHWGAFFMHAPGMEKMHVRHFAGYGTKRRPVGVAGSGCAFLRCLPVAGGHYENSLLLGPAQCNQFTSKKQNNLQKSIRIK
jgi:hypothetical protein